MKPLLHTIPIVLVGTALQDKVNFTEVGDVAVCSLNPPMLMISLHERHLSTAHIRQTGCFSINLVDVDMMKQADYCGMMSGHNTDKSLIFDHAFYDIQTPYINKSPLAHILNVEKEVYVEKHYIFIGRVLETKIRADIMKDDQICFEKINPLHYGLDNKYYKTGSVIGSGYHEGKNI